MNKQWQTIFYKKFGEEVKKARTAKHLTIHKLSVKAGIQYTTIKRMEDGDGFQFFHAVWLLQTLEMDINRLIQNLPICNTRIELSAPVNINDMIGAPTHEQKEIQIEDLI